MAISEGKSPQSLQLSHYQYSCRGRGALFIIVYPKFHYNIHKSNFIKYHVDQRILDLGCGMGFVMGNDFTFPLIVFSFLAAVKTLFFRMDTSSLLFFVLQ